MGKRVLLEGLGGVSEELDVYVGFWSISDSESSVSKLVKKVPYIRSGSERLWFVDFVKEQ